MACRCGRPNPYPCCGRVHTWASFDNPEKKCQHCGLTKTEFSQTKTPDRTRPTR